MDETTKRLIVERRKKVVEGIYASLETFSREISELVTDYAFLIPFEFLPRETLSWESRFSLQVSVALFSVRLIPPPSGGWILPPRAGWWYNGNWFIGLRTKQFPYHTYRISDDGHLLSPDQTMHHRKLQNWKPFQANTTIIASLWFNLESRSIIFKLNDNLVQVYTAETAEAFANSRPYVEMWHPEGSTEILTSSNKDTDIDEPPFHLFLDSIRVVVAPKDPPIVYPPPKPAALARVHPRHGGSILLNITEVSQKPTAILNLWFESSDTIENVRQRIAEQKNTNPDRIGRLVFAGRQLNNDQLTLAYYNVPSQATIHLVGCLRGS
jgi:hypothetical protein